MNGSTLSSDDAQSIDRIVSESVDRRLGPLVEDEIAKRADRRFRQLKVFVALVGLVGLGTFGTLANYLIESAVTKRLEHATGGISDSLEFSKFYTISLKLDLGDNFTSKDLAAIMNYLRSVEGNSSVRRSPEFIAALFQVTESLASAGQSASIDEIFKLYEPEILANPELIQPLLHHYGQEIVGRASSPVEDYGYKVFEKIERLAASAKVPELGIAYRVLYETEKGGDGADAMIAGLVRRGSELVERDRILFLNTIVRRSRAENWIVNPTAEGRKIERVVRDLFGKHADAFLESFGIPTEVSGHLAQHGFDEVDSDRLSRKYGSGSGEGIASEEADGIGLFQFPGAGGLSGE